METEVLLYHAELGSLEQIADRLWKLEEELSRKGLFNEALTVEGASRSIMDILSINKVREVSARMTDD